MIPSAEIGRICVLALSATPPHPVEDSIPVLPLLHIDEVDNNQPTYIAETYLPGGFRCGFAIDLENSVVLVALILMGACVNVDG